MRTGDEGYVKNHEIYVVDRLKELIKVRGFQVAPAEVSQEELGCEVKWLAGRVWLHDASARLCASRLLIKVVDKPSRPGCQIPNLIPDPRHEFGSASRL